jgi:type II secretory pathway pseudopilin PulG
MNAGSPVSRAVGCTRIAILVIVVILALLAMTITQAGGSGGHEQRVQVARDYVKLIADAARGFILHYHRVPTLGDLTARDGKNEPELEDLPRDPWGHDYELRAGTSLNDIVAVSAGPDGVFGNADDIRSRPGR